jgi:hypothetical protein
MGLICKDLAGYGVVLLPPDTENYFELLADIERRLQSRPKGSPPLPPSDDDPPSRISEHDTSGSAILLNQAQVAIAFVAYFWTFRQASGHVVTASHLPGTNPSVLLPFGLDDRRKKLRAFWNTIFPGSKRLMTVDGRQYGDNTDVRPPAEDELWHGGSFGFGVGGRPQPGEPLKLTLDGVFFVDGGFAGANRLGAWEQTVFAAEAYLACAALARETRGKGTPPDDFLAQVQQITGQTDEARMPPPPPPPHPAESEADADSIRRFARQWVGRQVLQMRKMQGDEAVIAAVAAWSDAPVPEFHKL